MSVYRVVTYLVSDESEEVVDLVEFESPLDLKNDGKNVFNLIDHFYESEKISDPVFAYVNAVSHFRSIFDPLYSEAIRLNLVA